MVGKTDTRMMSVPRETGNGYRLQAMTPKEFKAYVDELARPDFTSAHGNTTPAIFDDLFKRQQGLCCICMTPLDVTTAYYEQGEADGIHCENCSSVMTVRRTDSPSSYTNDAHLKRGR